MPNEDRFGPPADRGKLAAAISNAIVGIFREYYGRGASRARTVMGADYVITFLEDIYTPVERTLIEAGRFAAVAADGPLTLAVLALCAFQLTSRVPM